MMQWKNALALGMAAAAVAVPAPAYAYVQPIWLGVNQSYYLNTGSGISRVAVANPKIADVKILGASALNVVAFAPGTTTLNIWTKNGMRQEYSVTVSKEDKGLAAIIEKAIDLPHVEVTMVGDRVLLKGHVENQYEKELAFKIACLYVGDDTVAQTKKVTKKMQDNVSGIASNIEGDEAIDTSARVVNLLEMTNPDQINIEAMVIEINSDAAKQLGVEYSSPSNVEYDNDSNWTKVTNGSTGSFYAGETYGKTRDQGNHWYNRNWLFTHFSQINADIHALVNKGKARIISRPNITTMSGKTAGILVGGQIPVPMKSNDTVSVEYKPYGIQLNLVKPAVDNDGNITADVQAIVSRLDWSNAVTVNGFNMPGLITRQATTVVNIPTGMTMAIGGLLNSEDSQTISKVPLLGNIPVVGELFKYHNKSRQKSEIMILITPRVVNEQTRTSMSEKMKDAYIESRREKQKMPSVDLNEELPAKQEEKKEKPVKPKKQPKVAKETAAEPQPQAGSFAERLAALRKEIAEEKQAEEAAADIKPAVVKASKQTSTVYSLDNIQKPEVIQGAQ